MARVRAWHIANTTVRNPKRLRIGLEALVAAGFEGRMGKENEEEIAHALHNAGVVRLNLATTDVTSISRKWRSAFVQLGLIWPDVTMRPKIDSITQSQIGRPFTLTPLGRGLLQAKTLRAEQEILLRSLAVFQLPSVLEKRYALPKFSPLRFMISLVRELENRGLDPHISRLEMATIVINRSPKDGLLEIIKEINNQRTARAKAKSKRKFDTNAFMEAKNTTGISRGTLKDYQDLVSRYLKATGLFQSRGRGIALVPEQRRQAEMLLNDYAPFEDGLSYIEALSAGATLPTDSRKGSERILHDLRTVAKEFNVSVDESSYDTNNDVALSNLRHLYEDLIFESKERRFAEAQAQQVDEILTYMRMLDTNKQSCEFNDRLLQIPSDERPAYFEWVIWRLLLAFNHLITPPNQVRKFNIDQDFLPVHTAPGGSADLIAEYKDFVLVIEVTLTENSRQEAAEGEPVRRHVASVLEDFKEQNKNVFGLFIARNIDTNTSQTFKIGIWWIEGTRNVSLDIIPITLSKLCSIVDSCTQNEALHPSILRKLINRCVRERELALNAPDWKSRIENIDIDSLF